MALEKLATEVKYPSTYRKFGCREIYSFAMIGEHQQKCQYIPQACPVNKLYLGTCTWTGTRSKMETYMKQAHRSAILHQLKAKIIRLHNKRIQTITVDARDPTMYQGENPSLFHLIQGRKWRDARMITEIRDENGQLQTTTRGILNTFVGYMK